MKILLFICLVASVSAHASKARLEALGQNKDGSYYIPDTRSVILNPAFLNDFSNYFISEWGGASSSTADSSSAPHAEAGIFKKYKNLHYGLYLGNHQYSYNNPYGTVDRNAAGFLSRDNPLDFYLAGENLIKWGVSLSYARSLDEAQNANFELSQKSYHAKVGTILGNLQLYLHYTLYDKSKADNSSANNRWESRGNSKMGFSFSFKGGRVFFDHQSLQIAETEAGVNSIYQMISTDIGMGITRKVSKKARLFYHLLYHDEQAGMSARPIDNKYFEINAAFEYDALKILTLRGAIKGEFLNETVIDGKKEPRTNATKVFAGATLNFDDLKIDGSIGTMNAAGTINGGPTSNEGILRADVLTSRVAVHYWF